MLIVTFPQADPAWGSDSCSTEALIASQTASPPASSVSGRTIMNSSPPYLPSRSPGLFSCRDTALTTSFRHRSPPTWP